MLNNKYGYFSDDGKEYIITDPNTPRPWINFLTNGTFTSLVSHTGGGYSFIVESSYNRITRELPGDSLLYDRPGRYIYVRDNETKKFWTLNWQPVLKKPQSWEGRVGLGYNKLKCLNEDIEGEITYFVPIDSNLEVWSVKLKNKSDKRRDLSLFSYVEWVLGGYWKDLTERIFDSLFNDVYFEDNIIYATKRRWERPDKPGIPWGYTAYLTGNQKFDRFDLNKEAFIGQYRNPAYPISVERGECQNSLGESEDAVGVLFKKVVLNPGEEFSCDFILGAEKNKEDIKRKVEEFFTHEKIEEELKKVKDFYENYLDKVWVKTPDPVFDLSLNIWNKYQTWVTANLGEMDSYFIGGSNFGFRDECQHIYGVLPIDSQFVKKWVVELLKHQLKEGQTAHSWNLVTDEAVVTNHSDDAQWLVMAVLNYLKETGDLNFLKEKIPYLDEGEGDVFEHTLAALDYTLFHVSPNGVPLRRTADWNDALAGGHLGRGESLMVANQLLSNIKEFIPILKKLGNEKLVDKYSHVYERMKEVLNKDFWDGDWYIRATDDQDNHIGSAKNTEGKIHLEGQAWPVISGVANQERGEQALNAAWQHLGTPYGLCLFLPPYSKANEGLGIISQFAPGTKENGAIFTHPNAWMLIAECILGRGDKAFELWQKTSFLERGKEPELYKVEPYVYCEFTYGPNSSHFGTGSYSWMTGSAAWFFQAALASILGIQPTLEGLKIDPCIPKSWPGFSVRRVFREATYEIKVENQSKVSHGVKEIKVDGQKLDGQIIPEYPKGSTHKVKVIM
ncbi:MAG: hypothetical protein A2Y57_01235 [Candidatus Woykebacteria bacterium RBG_13_40_7b]|uniref:Uncharacterized protein n=1 Tax=Candidatus Woykebacteria bacterium RBG_13_40_7b TaxID=1802594 RepID=A0A1G1WA60_9BACT|nr:MAG: hypothetical protein A2Y57_01235 [Candidatus Woykebacteria bacterium RBG_13_40_7b]